MHLSTEWANSSFVNNSDERGGEKMLSKKIIIPVLALTLTGATVFGIAKVNAQSTTQPYQGLVQAIAQKFNLNQSQVQSVVDQYREQLQASRQQQRQDKLKTKLNTLVQQGKITAAQEQSILAEFVKLQGEYNPANIQNLTRAQRQQEFQKRQQELQSWASSQGIYLSLIRSLGNEAKMGGMMHHEAWGNDTDDTTVTPTP